MNTIIHAAFRRDLARFEDALAAFPIGSRARADQLAAAWDNFSFQLHHHHQDEETIFWPVLRELGAGEAMVGELEGEHARMASALDAADSAMRIFQTDPTAANVSSALAAIKQLGEVARDHLAHEERDMEPISVAHHASPQMKAAQKDVRKAHKGNAGTFFAWLLDDASPEVKSGLGRTVPPPVLFVISRIGGRDYHRRVASIWT
jgi:hypothetical protein